MADFSASFVPIVVPSAPAEATANALATYQTSFTSSIVNTGNSLLAASIALKDTDFFSIGDLPTLFNQYQRIDTDLYAVAAERPNQTHRPTIDFASINSKLDQLAALVAPAAPALDAISAETPELEAQAPTITLPLAPDPDVGAAPGASPSIIEPGLPTAPVVLLPPVPSFDDLQLPSPPAFVIPTFDDEPPQFLLAPPTAQFSYVDSGYTSSLQDPLVAKLLEDLTYGTYGIEPADEDALWGRARDRAGSQANSEIVEVMRRAAATSFPMPQGALYDAIAQAEQKHAAALSEANREIFLKRSDMYVEGRKFTFTQIQEYERTAIALYNATQERALNFAKAVVDTSIALYDASVRNFNSALESYKTRASVFETRIRGELVKAEIFKAQVAAESLRVDFNRAKIDQYLAQLKGIDSVIDLYKSELVATGLLMQIQQQKLDVFKTEISIYSERIKAKESEFALYLAGIRGELAKLDVYKSEIDAYNSRLGAVELQAKVKLQSNESLIQQYKSESQVFFDKLSQFAKTIDAMLAQAKEQTAVYSTDLDAYKAYAGISMDTARVQAGIMAKYIDWDVKAVDTKVDQVRFRLEQLNQSVKLQESVNRHGMEFLRAALGGAASGINSLGVSTKEE
jgi:hypothetical protein